MTCFQTQSLITKYMNDELDLDTLELFIEHINHCSDCREELEVYYMLLTGMRQLDEDRVLSSDFHVGFINKLKRSEDRLFQKKFSVIKKRIYLCCAVVVIALLLNYSEIYLTSTPKNREELKESSFELRFYYYKNKMVNLDQYIEQYQNHQ